MVSSVEGISSKVSSIEGCGAATTGVSKEQEELVVPVKALCDFFCFRTSLTPLLLDRKSVV